MDKTYHQTDLSKSSFLVTGGAGFIGSHLAAYLLRHGAQKVTLLYTLRQSISYRTAMNIPMNQVT